ncbi:hypothetical protein HMPREF2912_06440 [Corynebacterium sp. HMSC056E09]|uniref:hypothetical protein n=1 Tax=Corynebacterium sp. HMSC056E09 TaxID=1739416 RepID=UPI0008A13427|nr:hypothetical protein [Corynebacterium sp. HMSC056E09]OFQ90210.1 hypothetical protein HMPREF2912_06440 [Corynebacterium sp. HMSC056E09]
MICALVDCGGHFTDAHTTALIEASQRGIRVEHFRFAEVPSRQELKAIDALASEILPEDPTPSLDEIAAQPDVSHLGTPGPAPQAPFLRERLRVVVIGSDAALSAVLTRMMRADYLWAEVGYVPTREHSTAAMNWGLKSSEPGQVLDEQGAASEEALTFAITAPAKPVPLIRNDAGLVVAGSATIAEWSNEEITGEIIVDDAVLLRADREKDVFGAKLVPMTNAPGIVAAKAVTSFEANEAPRRGLFARLRKPAQPGQLDPSSVVQGRAVQAGGPALSVSVDGVRAKRPVKRVTFYRHLRDLQIVRP